MNEWLLTALTFLPVAGALGLCLFRPEQEKQAISVEQEPEGSTE